VANKNHNNQISNYIDSWLKVTKIKLHKVHVVTENLSW